MYTGFGTLEPKHEKKKNIPAEKSVHDRLLFFKEIFCILESEVWVAGAIGTKGKHVAIWSMCRKHVKIGLKNGMSKGTSPKHVYVCFSSEFCI